MTKKVSFCIQKSTIKKVLASGYNQQSGVPCRIPTAHRGLAKKAPEQGRGRGGKSGAPPPI
jgi:hypothetical protein